MAKFKAPLFFSFMSKEIYHLVDVFTRGLLLLGG